jgi:hypothetical protein
MQQGKNTTTQGVCPCWLLATVSSLCMQDFPRVSNKVGWVWLGQETFVLYGDDSARESRASRQNQSAHCYDIILGSRNSGCWTAMIRAIHGCAHFAAEKYDRVQFVSDRYVTRCLTGS